MNTIAILREHFATELSYAKVGVEMATTQREKNEVMFFAVQRCLGMATIAQSFGASFEEVEPLYEEIRDEILKLGD